jgi:hypothetical protein
MAEHRTGWTAQDVLETRHCSLPSSASCSWSEYTTEQNKHVCDSDIAPLAPGLLQVEVWSGSSASKIPNIARKKNDSVTRLLRFFEPFAYLKMTAEISQLLVQRTGVFGLSTCGLENISLVL